MLTLVNKWVSVTRENGKSAITGWGLAAAKRTHLEHRLMTIQIDVRTRNTTRFNIYDWRMTLFNDVNPCQLTRKNVIFCIIISDAFDLWEIRTWINDCGPVWYLDRQYTDEDVSSTKQKLCGQTLEIVRYKLSSYADLSVYSGSTFAPVNNCRVCARRIRRRVEHALFSELPGLPGALSMTAVNASN